MLVILITMFAFTTKNDKQLKVNIHTESVNDTIKCKACTDGYIKCLTCSGRKEVTITDTCIRCLGKGNMQCENGCFGSGYLYCPAAGCISGKVSSVCRSCIGRTAKEAEQCTNCFGSRIAYVSCTTCNGKGDICHAHCNCTGVVTCSKCFGAKSTVINSPCIDCLAKGIVKCLECNGTGVIPTKN